MFSWLTLGQAPTSLGHPNALVVDPGTSIMAIGSSQYFSWLTLGQAPTSLGHPNALVVDPGTSIMAIGSSQYYCII